MKTYRVYFYCPSLPHYKVIEEGLPLHKAEEKTKHLNHVKQFNKSMMKCCVYYFELDSEEKLIDKN